MNRFSSHTARAATDSLLGGSSPGRECKMRVPVEQWIDQIVLPNPAAQRAAMIAELQLIQVQNRLLKGVVERLATFHSRDVCEGVEAPKSNLT